MSGKPAPGLPLACVPRAIEADLRPEHFARIKRLFGQASWSPW